MAEKYSIHRFTGDGSKTDWEFNFAGGYISREHVKATVRDVNDLEQPVSFTWVGPYTIRIVPAVAAGRRLTVRRDTPKDLPLVDYTDGAIINEKNLDTTAMQAVFITAEMVDEFDDVTLDSVQALINSAAAVQTAQSALDIANASTGTAATALANANAAVGVAGAANTKADAAVATAGSANSKADTAITTANAADGKANTAIGSAANANTTANTAASQSAAAEITAAGAVGVANDARTRALDAQGAAGNAVATANAADTKANAVRAEFDVLAESVEEIAGGDLTNFVRVNVSNSFSIIQRFQQGFSIGPAGDNFTIRSDGKFRYSSAFEWADFGKPAWGDVRDKPLTFPSTWATVSGKPDLVVNGQFGISAGVPAVVGNASLFAGDANYTGILNFATASGLRAGYIGNGHVSDKRLLFVTDNGYSWGFTARPDFAGATPWDSANFSPADYMLTAGASTRSLIVSSATPSRGFLQALPGSSGANSAVLTFYGNNGASVNIGHITANTTAGMQYVAGVGTHVFDKRPTFAGSVPWDAANLPRPATWLNAGDGGVIRSNVGLGRLEFSTALISGWYTIPREGLYDVTFKDGTFSRGDGTGYVFLGGGAYIGHDGTNYVFGGTKPVRVNSLESATEVYYRGGTKLPKITVGGTAPASPAVGDLWFE